MEARLRILTDVTGIEPERLLRLIVAWTGLSAAWFITDGDNESAAIDLAINQIALPLLG